MRQQKSSAFATLRDIGGPSQFFKKGQMLITAPLRFLDKSAGGSLHQEGHQSTLMGEYMNACINDAIDELDTTELQNLLSHMLESDPIRSNSNILNILRTTKPFGSDRGLIGIKEGE